MIKIAKFGGSSVADAEHFKKIKAIVDADPARRFVVVSACGRRFKGDTKVTDLLYLVSAHVKYHVSCEDLLKDIGQRYFDIADELELTYPIREEFAAFAERASTGGYSTEELVSRGEYFTARLMAEYLGLPFLDASKVIAFHHDGTLSMRRTTELVEEYSQQAGFVMPGFYGATREGQIKLLDRGGGHLWIYSCQVPGRRPIRELDRRIGLLLGRSAHCSRGTAYRTCYLRGAARAFLHGCKCFA